ncbi:MAG: NUDIX hydrolase [Betaproteobacteria bacterium]|nr:NUDIX hydrolase [Betaproteobacteria bacterium]
MELNNETVTTPPMDAASVLLLRDSAQGLQVLLLRRHHASKVLGGAYVFPGGKLDAEDQMPEALPWLSETPAQLHARLQEPDLPPSRAAGLFMAALREAFEECGVLAGQDSLGPAMAEQLRQHHATRSWHASLREGSLRLRTEEMLPWSRWITPRQPSVTNKRFDTRFFLTRVCDAQEAAHDNFETTDSVWLTPLQALERFAAGQIELAPPQIMSLYQLKAHADVDQALAEARLRAPALIEPEPFDEQGQRVICYPGDPRHSVPTPALRGPSRLVFLGGRFTPVDGMGALLG